MVNKFVNFEREMEKEEKKSRNDVGSKDENVTSDHQSAGGEDQMTENQQAAFSAKIFDPDQYMPFDAAIRNICMYSQKQSNFEKRRDEASRRAYIDKSADNYVFRSRTGGIGAENQGYTDGFVLSTRSTDHTKNMNIRERFNQHTRKPAQSWSKGTGGPGRFNALIHTKVSTGQALFNLNKTLPKRDKSYFDATMRQNRLQLGRNITSLFGSPLNQIGSSQSGTTHQTRAVLI